MIHPVIDQPIHGGNMNLRPTHLLSLFAAASLGLAAPGIAHGAPSDGPAYTAIGLTTAQHLVTFQVNDPWTTQDIGAITGLDGDTTIVGIDYRVQDGLLYGLGEAGGVYSFEGVVATKVSQLTVALAGTHWGVDFNPAADRLQIVSDTGQNLSHDLKLGEDPATVDGETTEDAPLNYLGNESVAIGTSVAYANNDLTDTTDTTLYNIDTNLDQTVTQTAVSGVLTPVGALGLDPATGAGFDIHSTLDENGAAVSNAGYAALSINGVYGLWGIDLTTGLASEVCDFPDELQVTDLAVQLVQLAPAE
jgi:hypothetical protein